MSTSEWINLSGVLVSALGVLVAIWVGYTIQTALTAERAIKDILIKRVDNLSDSYYDLYRSLIEEGVNPRFILSWFKSFNIESLSLLKKLEVMYDIDSDYLRVFQSELRELITNDESYLNGFNLDVFKPSTLLTNKIQTFHKEYQHLFLELICDINEAKRT